MPYKPKKPCAYPGCPELTTGKYCDKHAQQRAKEYEQNGRDEQHNDHYGRGWRKIRAAYANAHPLCEECMKRGVYVKADEVHHIKPLRDGGTNAPSNLINLCRKCHAEAHAKLGTRSHNKTTYTYDGKRS
ncbi:MAG: HNH endonuclease [Clostridiales bacterium]|nr:HNH endonuclease [Clostridiales bacterium]